ncbi:ATP-binding protein [Streptomyces malaysiensis]|uniref:ATP-binding protein n=1 Tax=Streptomyces malaysiensis TaxID=92644 RepID=UPI001E2A31F3|nr:MULTISPECIES: ATP-binding protein [unclassified Streptomyces]
MTCFSDTRCDELAFWNHPRRGDAMLPMTNDNQQQTMAQRWAMQFTSTPRCVRLVRSLVNKTLLSWGYGREDIDRTVLVRSELAANAVRHGHRHGHRFEVRLSGEGATCLVEVSDPLSRRLPRLLETSDEDEHGRGLQLVSALAKEMGHRARNPIGKTVWARLSLVTPEEETRA